MKRKGFYRGKDKEVNPNLRYESIYEGFKNKMSKLANNRRDVFGGVLLGSLVALIFFLFFYSGSVVSVNVLQNIAVNQSVNVPDTYDYLEQINRTVVEINRTTHRINVSVGFLFDRENCTVGNHVDEVGTKCWYLALLNDTLQWINTTVTEINSSTSGASLTNTLIGNVLASFGKNLYVVSGDRTSINDNLTGYDGIAENILWYNNTRSNITRKMYFYLEQLPYSNLTVELWATNHTGSGSDPYTNITLWINSNRILNNWSFDASVGAHIIANISTTILSKGENTFNITAYDNNFSLDYAIIFTDSAALRFMRATQYNATSIYNYLYDDIYPYLPSINATVENIYNDTDWLYNTLNCTEADFMGNDSICTRLHRILNHTYELKDNVTVIQNQLWSTNDSIVGHITGTNSTLHAKLSGMNGTLMSIDYYVRLIKNMTNCTADAPNDVLCQKINNITRLITTVNSSVYNVSRILIRVNTTVTEINTTTHNIWERWSRKNATIVDETIIHRNLSSNYNLSIEYNITVPSKEGFETGEYLPVRWKFWFIRVDSPAVCINQNREFKNIEPYCNPLVAQYVGAIGSTYNVNISLRPSLSIGNYTVVREVEVDPPENGQPVWHLYGREPVMQIQVIESTAEELQGTGSAAVLAPDTNYIDDEEGWEERYESIAPTPTLLTIEGERNVIYGSIKVEVSNTFVPDKQISVTNVYENIIQDGEYSIPLLVNLVQGYEYQVELTICEGPTFDPEKYDCEIAAEKFIA